MKLILSKELGKKSKSQKFPNIEKNKLTSTSRAFYMYYLLNAYIKDNIKTTTTCTPAIY